MLQVFHKVFIPNKVIAIGAAKNSGDQDIPLLAHKKLINGTQGSVYVCEDKLYKLPTTDPQRALKLSSEFQTYSLPD